MADRDSTFLPLLIELDKKLDTHRQELMDRIESNQVRQDHAVEKLAGKIDELRADIRNEVRELQKDVDKVKERTTAHDHAIGWIAKGSASAGLALITSLVTKAMGWWGHGR